MRRCSRSRIWSKRRRINGSARTSRAGMTLGYDPWLHTAENAEKLAKACASVGAKLVPLDANPVDAIWTDRPAPPLGKIVAHDLKFAGEDVAEQTRTHSRHDRQIARRRAGGVRSAQRGLDLQHPRHPTSRIRRCRSATRSFRKKAGRRSISTAASSTMRCGLAWKNSRMCASRRISSTGSKRSAAPRPMCGSTRRPRRMRCRASSRGRRHRRARAGSDRRHEGGEERHRDHGHARSASPRRRGDGALSRLVRPRSRRKAN